MPIETNCPGCGRLLRVADENAGRQARCPVCNTIYVVPGASSGASESPVAEERWYMKTPDQQVYGPVSQGELQGWHHEGRIGANCQIRSEHDPAWRPASEYFPVGPAHPASATGGSPFAGATPAAAVPPAGGGWSPRHGRLAPHRGGLILVFGILSWALCPLFGVVAWIMGNSDLAEMRNGRMDPRGESLTRVGRVLGMVHVLLLLAFLGLFLLVALLATA